MCFEPDGVKGSVPDVASFRRLMFRISDDLFVALEYRTLTVFASSHEGAGSQLKLLAAKYRNPSAAQFQILTNQCGVMDAEPVKLAASRLMNRNDLALHYGDDFPAWEEEMVQLLVERSSGVSILRGEPGTGKTTFLRHLVHRLRDTHRFFYVPVTHHALLSSPDMGSFWVRQNNEFPQYSSVVLLEDAESLIERRHLNNREHLANLLNISDGLLGEFLKVQVICTLNCELDRIDAALLRAGRLLACRQFRRLTGSEARRLAQAKGFQLPDRQDYSVAEIYHPQKLITEQPPERKVGFAMSS